MVFYFFSFDAFPAPRYNLQLLDAIHKSSGKPNSHSFRLLQEKLVT